MLVVLDTNVIVSSLSRRSESNWLVQSLLHGDYVVVISNDILTEYEEILAQKYGARLTADFLDALDVLPNVIRTEVYFQWNLLQDADDNKFADAAFAAGAEHIVSEDRGFRLLKQIDFPKISVLSLDEFRAVLFSI